MALSIAKKLARAATSLVFTCALSTYAPSAQAEVLNYEYDARARLTGTLYTNGSTASYAYDVAGNRTEVAVSAGCINTTCSGTNSIVFRVRNGAGANNDYPFWCVGNWTMNTVGAVYDSTCSTGWIPIGCRSFCPDTWLPPTRTEYDCINALCAGVNTILAVIRNGDGVNNGSQKWLCEGVWTMNVSGSNYVSTCATGWVPYP